VIRGLLRLSLLAAAGAWLLERRLAAASDGRGPAAIESLVVIDAPIERVWAEIADVEGQPRWMHDLKSVRIETPGPVGAGTRANGVVRIFGISVTDPITITAFEPPRRFAIRHEGLFTGHGVIDLEAGADGTTTIVRWHETLIPPLLPHLGSLLGQPVLREIFQADLNRLRDLVEG
jgi:uncharacterized protein YndB with AHSA1/START domain